MPEHDVLIFLEGTIKVCPRIESPKGTRQMLFPTDDDVLLFYLAFDPETSNKVQVWVQM